MDTDVLGEQVASVFRAKLRKVNVMLSVCLTNQTLCHEGMRGGVKMRHSFAILDLDNGWKGVVSCAHPAALPQVEESPLSIEWVGIRGALDTEECRNVSYHCLESNPDPSAHRPLLYRLIYPRVN